MTIPKATLIPPERNINAEILPQGGGRRECAHPSQEKQCAAKGTGRRRVFKMEGESAIVWRGPVKTRGPPGVEIAFKFWKDERHKDEVGPDGLDKKPRQAKHGQWKPLFPLIPGDINSPPPMGLRTLSFSDYSYHLSHKQPKTPTKVGKSVIRGTRSAEPRSGKWDTKGGTPIAMPMSRKKSRGRRRIRLEARA